MKKTRKFLDSDNVVSIKLNETFNNARYAFFHENISKDQQFFTVTINKDNSKIIDVEFFIDKLNDFFLFFVKKIKKKK